MRRALFHFFLFLFLIWSLLEPTRKAFGQRALERLGFQVVAEQPVVNVPADRRLVNCKRFHRVLHAGREGGKKEEEEEEEDGDDEENERR